MTFIPGPSGNKSTVNSNSSLATTGFNSRQNTAQSGSTTSIVLDASAFASDDTYNDQIIGIVSGTGIGQHSVITDYNGTNDANILGANNERGKRQAAAAIKRKTLGGVDNPFGDTISNPIRITGDADVDAIIQTQTGRTAPGGQKT